MTIDRRATRVVAGILVVLLASACGAPSTSAPPTTTSSSPAGASAAPAASAGAVATPAASGPAVVGPVDATPPAVDVAADQRLALARADADDRDRVRDLAGFSTVVGTGWAPLAAAGDAAVDGAVSALATDLGIEVPIASRDRRLASIADPAPVDRPAPASAASAMAIVTAAMVAAAGLGNGGTTESSRSDSRTITEGDDVATVSISARGTVTGTGSRVVAEFTFDLTGDVRNTVTGATAHMTGTATARVEIDGCPDENGSSKGKVTLSSTESVSGQDASAGIAGWTRDLSGAFDINVSDEAAIAGLVLDADARESVTGAADDDDTQGHDLNVRAHWVYGAGSGFEGLTYDEGASDGELVSERGATAADIAPLFRSAAFAISSAAILLGDAAEKFWRGGKCVEVIVDPDGGDVDADSITDVVAKVKHRYEGNELDKPVEAALAGVAKIDPAEERQPAPATVHYTAGHEDGEVGTVTFKTVSNRGIGEKAVKFTVRPAVWEVTFRGTDKETLGPVKNTFAVTLRDLKITATDGVLSGTGKLRLKGTVTSGSCSGKIDQVATTTVTGNLVGTGPEAVLRVVMRSESPAGDTVTMGCPGLTQVLGADGHAERFGEPLQEFDLPAAGGSVRVNKTAAVGGIFKVTVKGTFKVTKGQ